MATEISKQPTVSSSVNDTTTTTILRDGDVPDTSTANTDEQVIEALGYKQEFKREFSLWTTFCVSFAVLGLLPSFASTMTYGMFTGSCLLDRIVSGADDSRDIIEMGYAGTAGMVWGWIIAMVFIQCVAMAMAELCSAMPTRYSFICHPGQDAPYGIKLTG